MKNALTLVGVFLIVLKLMAIAPVAGFPWLLVLAPFWVPVVLKLVGWIAVAVVAIAVVTALL